MDIIIPLIGIFGALAIIILMANLHLNAFVTVVVVGLAVCLFIISMAIIGTKKSKEGESTGHRALQK